MQSIWKFQFPTTGLFSLRVPKDSQILGIQVQKGIPCLWALVDTEKQPEDRSFIIYGTGHLIKELDNQKYIDTYQIMDGDLVFHVFEILEQKPN